MAQKKVFIQTLYDLMLMKKEVDPHDLLSQADSFYRSIKAVGVKETNVMYYDYNENEKVVKAIELPEEMRAMIGFIVTLIYRWSDSSSRLEQHFGLTTKINMILDHTGIFRNDGLNIEILTVKDVIDKYLSINNK